MTATQKKRPFLVILVALIAFLVLFAIVLGVAGLITLSVLDRPPTAMPGGGVEFRVSAGESGNSVARRLAQSRAIKSEILFRLLMKARSLDQSLKAGDYLIQADMGASSILDMIASGRQILVRVTIPEGASVGTAATMAENAGVASAKSVLDAVSNPALLHSLALPATSAVGYLFPDTYLLPKNAGAEQLVRLMVETFRRKLAQDIPESTGLSPVELHERVILASIVEREYRVADEAPIMASVFLNRLRIGMALQSCATVVYVLSERQGKPHPARLFDRDLAVQDPFNTYMHPGLPPAPICNPGLTALTAVFRPASSKYLYFRLIDEAAGRHYFSETLDEHIKAAVLAVKPKSQ
jgi:UPF0755 protein